MNLANQLRQEINNKKLKMKEMEDFLKAKNNQILEDHINKLPEFLNFIINYIKNHNTGCLIIDCCQTWLKFDGCSTIINECFEKIIDYGIKEGFKVEAYKNCEIDKVYEVNINDGDGIRDWKYEPVNGPRIIFRW